MCKPLVVFLLLFPCAVLGQGVVLNEIMSSNRSTLFDEDHTAADWIELYNGGSRSVNLAGYGLSDDSLDAGKWKFGDTTIGPGEYLLVFASGKNRTTGTLHTNFKIDASGEAIILSDTSGITIDRVAVPASTADLSFGKTSGGWCFQTPTPGTANGGYEQADTVAVSLKDHFYNSPIAVVLAAGGDIYYTLDGKEPDSTSAKYGGPISIDTTSVLKAINREPGRMQSRTLVHTYFINEHTDLAVVSLSTDPYNLFDRNYGIYDDANIWNDWERPVHVEFFEGSGNPGFSEDCGISLYGAYTRRWPQKSFALKFKDEYGISKLQYPLFPDFRVTTFKSILLRNSGNDFYYTHIRDAMMQTLIKDLDIDYLEYRPTVTFINGAYWGIYNIRERISNHYLAYRHGVDPDSIDLLEHNGSTMAPICGDTLHYRRLIDYISTHNMATDEAYRYVDSTIDLDECLLYWAAEVYYNSQDWPANNVKFWRERSPRGKWRWILYDLDFGFNLYETTGQSENHLTYLLSGIETRPGSNPPWSTLLIRKLVQNPKIKTQFINLIADLLNTNFQPDRVLGIINTMAGRIANDIRRHWRRWPTIDTVQAKEHLTVRMPTFARERPAYLRGFVRDFFSCGGDGHITLNCAGGGRIKLNSLYFQPSEMPWSGVYFKGNEVQVKAIPTPGYKFDGWSGTVTSTDALIKVLVSDATTLTASFSVDTSVTKDIVINEINYNSSGSFAAGDWVEFYNRSIRAIDMGGWVFRDSDIRHAFTFPAGTVIGPAQYLVLVKNDSAFSALFPDVVNHIGRWDFGLDGGGEHIQLTDEEGRMIDSLTYDNKAPWPVEADGQGPTLELRDPSSDNAQAVNWMPSGGHGSPGRVNAGQTSIGETSRGIVPEKFSLIQNYPNPFNPETTIGYTIPKTSRVRITVTDVLGRELAILVNEEKLPGAYSLKWDASLFPSGIYFCTFQADSYRQTKKLVYLK